MAALKVHIKSYQNNVDVLTLHNLEFLSQPLSKYRFVTVNNQPNSNLNTNFSIPAYR